MYKDVGKRILAFAMMVCMLVTLVEWPTPVWAGTLYQNGDGAVSGEALSPEVKTVVAVFQSNGAESLQQIDFDVQVEGSASAKAAVSYYVNVQSGSGTCVFTEDITVHSGMNSIADRRISPMAAGSSFAIAITLDGATFRTFGGTKAGQSYLQVDGAWKDMYAYNGRCAAIRVRTANTTAVGSGSSTASQTYTDNSPVPAAGGDSSNIQLNKVSILIAVGEKSEVTLTGVDSSNQSKISWRMESADDPYASVSSPGESNRIGTVYGRQVGTTHVIASYNGIDYPCEVHVTENLSSSTITLDPPSPVVYRGSVYDPAVTVTASGYLLEKDTHYRVGYQKKGEDGGWVSTTPGADGSAFIDVGDYKVNAKNDTGAEGYRGFVSTDFVINPKDIAHESVIVELVPVTVQPNWEGYLETNAGNQKELDKLFERITDTEAYDVRQKLTIDKDYTLEVKPDLSGIVIKGMGNYTGERTISTPQSLELAGANIVFDTDQYIYTGRRKEPTFSVILQDGTTLSESDYTVVNWNLKRDDSEDFSVGEITIQIEGKGRFYGKKEGTYQIVAKDIDNLDCANGDIDVYVNLDMTTPTSLDAISSAIKLTYNGMTLVRDTDYTLSGPNQVSGTEVDNIPARYTVTITGRGNYTGIRTTKEFSVGTPISDYISGIKAEDCTYNGLAQEPYVTITWVDPNKQLTRGQDFVVEYDNNVNAGEATATVRVRGIGNYGGIIGETFTIKPLDLSSPDVRAYLVDENGKRMTEPYDPIEYSPDRADLKPGLDIVFMRDGKEVPVVLDTDYNAVYKVDSVIAGGVLVGDQTVTVTGTGNFTESRTLTYSIKACDLERSSAITAVLDQEVFNYTGSPITQPVMTITHRSRSGELFTLKENSDYTLQHSPDPQIEMGTYTVTATAKKPGNYTGSVWKAYEITAIDIATVVHKSDFDITSTNNADDYEGLYFALLWYDPSNNGDNTKNQLQFTIKVSETRGDKTEEVTLNPGEDYTVTYSGYEHVSSKGNVATATIQGQGKYYNSIKIQYLLAEDLGAYRVAMQGEGFGYRGRTFTGQAIELAEDEIRVFDAGSTLSRSVLEFGEDYTLSYQDSKDDSIGMAFNAGWATVYIEARSDIELPSANGCFRYKENENKVDNLFYIGKQNIADETCIRYDLIEVPYIDDTTRQMPSPRIYQVSEQGSYDLVKDTDYVIKDGGENIYPSPTDLDVTFVVADADAIEDGNYYGTLTVPFTIIGKSLDDILAITMESDNITYNGTYLMPDIVKVILSDGTVYDNTQVIKSKVCTWEHTDSYYDNNLNASMPGSRATITVHGVKEYAGRTRTFEFDILPLEFKEDVASTTDGYVEVEGLTPNYTYGFNQLKPVPTVVVCTTGGTKIELKAGEHYTLSYDRNRNVSDNGTREDRADDHTAVILTGVGNYTGEYRFDFAIDAKALWDEDNGTFAPGISMETIDSQVFEGLEVRPTPIIRYQYGEGEGDVYRLQSGVDFDCTYKDNDGPGEATITIKGQGNFTGTITTTFQIGESIATEGQFHVSYPGLESATYIYDGSPKEPSVLVEALQSTDAQGRQNWKTLQKGKDYIVEYVDPLLKTSSEDGAVNAGTATIVVKGTGIYAGKVEETFTILPKDLAIPQDPSKDEISLALPSVREDGTTPYTGKEITPHVAVSYSRLPSGTDQLLAKDKDYEVSYSDAHTDIGTVTVTVTGIGNNYVGSRSTTFEIVRAEIGSGRFEPAADFRVENIPVQPLVEGKAEPVPVLTYDWKPLRPNIDYSWTYEEGTNTKVGTGVVIIQGEGNYTGSVKKRFTIVASTEKVTVTGPPKSVVFEDWVSTVKDPDGTQTAKEYFEENGKLPDWFAITFDDEIVVTMEGVEEPLTPGVDYEIEYVGNDWIGAIAVNVVGTGTKFSGMVANTVTAMMTLPKNDEAIAGIPGLEWNIPPVEHTGSAVNAKPEIYYYGRQMESRHYYVTCSNNINVGEADVWITGNETNGVMGGYTGKFEIKANTNNFTVEGLEDSYMYRGEQIRPEITVKSGGETLAKGVDYELGYGDNIDVGTDAGYITITGIGRFNGSFQPVNFSILPWDVKDLGIKLEYTNVTYTGLENVPGATLTATIGKDDYTMPSSDYEVVKTDGANNTDRGTGRVTIRGISRNVTGEVEKTFTIGVKSLAVPPAGTPDQMTVEVKPQSYPYDGTQKMPDVTVTYRYGSRENQVRTLERDVDFTVSYSDNIKAGTATATINGINNYSGSRSVHFTITEQEFSEDQVTVVFPNGTTYIFMGTGVEIRPAMTVRVGEKTLTAGEDYSVTYKDNTAVGEATVTIKGKGSYVGQIEKKFTITAHDISAGDIVVKEIPNQGYTGSPLTPPEVVITCGGYTLVPGIDYNTAIVGDATGPGTVNMRITGIGGFYNERMTSFKIAADISGAVTEGLPETRPFQGQGLPYSIEELTRTLVVRINGVIVNSSNYTVEYAPGSDGFSVGEQKLILRGVNDYGGTKDLKFTITPKRISDSDVRMDGFLDNITGTTDYHQTIILIWKNSIKLEEGIDYDVIYEQLGSSNTWRMTVKGKGNYEGTIEKTYTMETVDIATATITLDSSSYTYTGSDIEPIVTVKVGDTILTQGTQYSVSYENNRNAGKGTVRVKGEGYYNGEVTLSFTILSKTIALATVTPDPIPVQVYTGKDVEPEVSVKDGDTGLIQKTDYTLRYQNTRKAGVGTGTVLIMGRGNYNATKTMQFDIMPYTVKSLVVTATTPDSIEISWSINGTATGYEIQRQTSGGGWQQIALVGSRTTSYRDQSLTANTTYTYRIRAYVVVDTNTTYGEWSDQVSGTVAN